MAKGMDLGENDVAKKGKRAYIGVGDLAKKWKKAYIGDANGVARQFFSGNVYRFLYTSSGQVDNEYKLYESNVKPPVTFASSTSPAQQGNYNNLLYDKDNERFILISVSNSASRAPYFYTVPEDGSTWTYVGQGSSTNNLFRSSKPFLNNNGTISYTYKEGTGSGNNYYYGATCFEVTDTVTGKGRFYCAPRGKDQSTGAKSVNGYTVGMDTYSTGATMDYISGATGTSTYITLESASTKTDRNSKCLMGGYYGCPVHYANGIYSVSWMRYVGSNYYVYTKRASNMADLGDSNPSSKRAFSVSSGAYSSMAFIYDDKLVFIVNGTGSYSGTYMNSTGVWVMDLTEDLASITAPTKVSTWCISAPTVANVVDDGENVYITAGNTMYYSPNLVTWTAVSLDTSALGAAVTKVET